MTESESLLEFPCKFPIKVMGAAIPEFRERVLEIARRHAPNLSEQAVSERSSRGGRYISLNIVVDATSREQLDGLYRELTGCELVAVVL
jgi:putative lipoic acid-binding regulatory protein